MNSFRRGKKTPEIIVISGVFLIKNFGKYLLEFHINFSDFFVQFS
jgi:hypothetical protein